MNIQWFPGHMAKTRRQIEEKLKLIDVVVEILDARIPVSSKNPDISEITRGKPRVVVLNKSDLADENITKEWVNFYKEQGVEVCLADCANEHREISQRMLVRPPAGNALPGTF